MIFPSIARTSFSSRRWGLATLAGCCVLVAGAWVAAAQGGASVDVLDRGSGKVVAVARGMVSGVASQGGRLVAVGPRGLILLSEDGGVKWRQVASPVAADLVTVRFVGPATAWAVGHDSVALRSVDGGASWERMLDGRAVLRLLNESASRSDAMQREIGRTMAQSATKDVWPAPLLDIRFSADGQNGFAVGAFGLILRTIDGGRRWETWLDRAENERRYHLYALAGNDGNVYIAGEQGMVLRLDAAGQRFVRVETPYNGSFFGIDQVGSRLVAYGLRGNAFVSQDGGRQWQKIETGTDANLVTAVARGDSLLLVSQSGDVLSVNFNDGRAASVAAAPGAEVYGAVLAGANHLALARLNGVGTVALPVESK